MAAISRRKTYRKERITQAMRQNVARRYGAKPGRDRWISCHYCESVILIDWIDENRVRFRDVDGRLTPELDHVIALSNGGPHEHHNLVPACLSCNRAKGAA